MIAALIVREMQEEYREVGFVKQILSLNLVPRKNVTNCGRNDTSLCDFSGECLTLTVAGITHHSDRLMFVLLSDIIIVFYGLHCNEKVSSFQTDNGLATNANVLA